MSNNWLKQIEENRKKVEEKDQKSKEKGLLKGRYIRERYADGYALYEVIRENKKTVRIRVITGIGDDWVLPCFGEETTIDKNYAMSNISGRDRIDEVFNRRG